MRRRFQSTRSRCKLRTCPTCHQPFVAPRDVLAAQDDGQLVVELQCVNCGWSSIALHQAPELVALDRALDHDSAQMEAAADALAVTLELERIDRFALALHEGHILPEDF
ncbi:MAG TPA: hypothetical protein VF257_04580 [Solirubrobacteraceae bacterium]